MFLRLSHSYVVPAGQTMTWFIFVVICISCLRLVEATTSHQACLSVCSLVGLRWALWCGKTPAQRIRWEKKGICWLKADLWHAYNSLLIQQINSFCFLSMDVAVTLSLNWSHIHCHGWTEENRLVCESVMWQNRSVMEGLSAWDSAESTESVIAHYWRFISPWDQYSDTVMLFMWMIFW